MSSSDPMTPETEGLRALLARDEREMSSSGAPAARDGLLPSVPPLTGRAGEAAAIPGAEPAKTEKVDWFNECAHETVKLPEGWRWYQISAVGRHPNFQGTMVKGMVPTRLISRGPHKGWPDWRTADKETEREVFVSEAAFDARKDRFEAETGRCRDCQGDGKALRSWSVDKGVTYRECHRCKGSGLAPAPCDRSPSGETPKGLTAEHESAVPATQGGADV